MRAVVLRDGELQVRDTADPVPGPGQLLLRPLSAAICASDVHYMDYPNSAPRFVWDPGRDTIMGHEFIGEVVGHGPGCSGDFPIGSRVTSLPLLIREGAEPHVIGHDPDAPGAFGELMLVSEVLSRTVPDAVPNDAVAVVDAFAVGEFYVRSSAIAPGELPLVVGAGAIGLSAVAALVARGVAPIIVSDYSAERLEYAKKFGAEILVNPSERSPYEVWREVARDKRIQKPQVIFECVGAPGLLARIIGSCEFLARLFAAGGWHGSDSVSVTEATHKGVTIQFGGGPHPVDWYGTLDAVVDGRLDPLPSIGKVIGLDEVPDAIDQAQFSGSTPRRRPPHRIMSVLPGPIRQIGHVVTDLDQALASWIEIGVGPWLVIRGLPMRALYRGEPCETTLSLALSNSGELQVELIQQQDDTPSIFTEFLAANGPGYHQLAYWAEDFDATMKAVEDVGWPVVWSGGEGLGVRFAYVEPPNSPTRPSTIVEISELTEGQAASAKFIRDAAADWDGSDPIREMGG